ncbi:MAG: cysteine--tRNA ligase [Verrucomicrobia bacterium]|nr:cysteine--tRNA ligase [Verrucomicrobiota bacterium]
MALRFFDTLTRTAREFEPIEPGKVGLYTCGPTVYNYAHLGNFRAYLFEDLLRRTLKYKGYAVTQVMNLTDVEDKTIRASREAGIPLGEYTKKYIDAFFEDLDTLNIERAEQYPRATEFVEAMVNIIKGLEEKGFAYRTDDGSVYFSIARFPGYGELAHINLDELRAGARVAQDEYDKETAADFALWKGWDPDDGDVKWDSPWGPGRPGWHIECSAMAMHYLGPHFDIHTGGVDNIFPHHQNEIAQSESYSGEKFVNYWLHNEHLIVEGRKMAKSFGNFFTLRDLLDKGYTGRQIRWLLLTTHYRARLNFTFDGLDSAKASLERIDDCLLKLEETAAKRGGEENGLVRPLVEKTRQQFGDGLDDDLNIAVSVAALFDFVRDVNKLLADSPVSAGEAQEAVAFLDEIDAVLGVIRFGKEAEIPAEITKLVEERQAARKARDFARADAIRDAITARGYTVEDVPGGYRIKKG